MACRKVPPETVARSVAASAEIPLDLGGLVASYSQSGLHEILRDDAAICHFLAQNDPSHPSLIYHRPGSSAHAQIVAWCHVETDLVRGPFGCSTFNGIAYDHPSRSFLEFAGKDCKDCVSRRQIKDGVLHAWSPDIVQASTVDGDFYLVFLKSWHFSERTARLMQEQRLISAPLCVAADFRCDS